MSLWRPRQHFLLPDLRLLFVPDISNNPVNHRPAELPNLVRIKTAANDGGWADSDDFKFKLAGGADITHGETHDYFSQAVSFDYKFGIFSILESRIERWWAFTLIESKFRARPAGLIG